MTLDKNRQLEARKQLVVVLASLTSLVWDMEVMDVLDDSYLAILRAQAIGGVAVAMRKIRELQDTVIDQEE